MPTQDTQGAQPTPPECRCAEIKASASELVDLLRDKWACPDRDAMTLYMASFLAGVAEKWAESPPENGFATGANFPGVGMLELEIRQPEGKPLSVLLQETRTSLEGEEREHLSTIEDRDLREDQIQNLHLQLGGDGEWSSCRDLGAECAELVGGLLSERDSLREQVRELVAALQQIQWGNTIYEPEGGENGTDYNLCPLCDQSEVHGHAPDCLVGMALGKHEKQEQDGPGGVS